MTSIKDTQQQFYDLQQDFLYLHGLTTSAFTDLSSLLAFFCKVNNTDFNDLTVRQLTVFLDNYNDFLNG